MSNSIHPHFLDQKGAARFLGVAPRTFRVYLKAFDIPRKGPKKNRYHIDDLLAFMDAPEQYRKGTATKPTRAAFTPVSI